MVAPQEMIIDSPISSGLSMVPSTRRGPTSTRSSTAMPRTCCHSELLRRRCVRSSIPAVFWGKAHRSGTLPTISGATNLLVVNMEQGRDLVHCLDQNRVVLMRGHGFAASGLTLIDVVRTSVYLPKNARVLMNALRLGGAKYLSPEEIEKRLEMGTGASEALRAWQYWAIRAGCADLLEGHPAAAT